MYATFVIDLLTVEKYVVPTLMSIAYPRKMTDFWILHVLFVTYMLFFVYQFQSSSIRTVTAEGLCKLTLNNKIKSPNLVAHLIIMWYNPLTGIAVLNLFLIACNVKTGHSMLQMAHLIYVCLGKAIAYSKLEQIYKKVHVLLLLCYL
jgi:hypothetical protein